MANSKPKLDNEFKVLLGIGIVLITIVVWVLFLLKSNMNDLNYKYGDIKMNVATPYSAPEFIGLTDWINSAPLKLADLRGKVVVIDFWTYSCINCIRTLPYIKEWYAKYKDDGLVIIGVHAPEFEFEKESDNVRTAVGRHGITYPVALDNDHETWQAFANRYWPAHYFIDKEGKVRHTHFGEGEYDQSEKIIQSLLAEGTDKEFGNVSTEEEAPFTAGQSPETYLGYYRANSLVNAAQAKQDQPADFTFPQDIPLHTWALQGKWELAGENAISRQDGAELQMHFAGKELYLVMESDDQSEKKVKVFIDGKSVNEIGIAGEDVSSAGEVTVTRGELYRLVKFPEFKANSVLKLIVPAGVRMNAFTFGG